MNGQAGVIALGPAVKLRYEPENVEQHNMVGISVQVHEYMSTRVYEYMSTVVNKYIST